MDGQFIIGDVYYKLGHAQFADGKEVRPAVSSWRYDGIVKLKCNSDLCDVPYHFLCFTRFPVELKPESLYIPSESQAHGTMFPWSEFRLDVFALGEDGMDFVFSGLE